MPRFLGPVSSWVLTVFSALCSQLFFTSPGFHVTVFLNASCIHSPNYLVFRTSNTGPFSLPCSHLHSPTVTQKQAGVSLLITFISTLDPRTQSLFIISQFIPCLKYTGKWIFWGWSDGAAADPGQNAVRFPSILYGPLSRSNF